MKKIVDGVLMDMTAEEIAQREQDTITDTAKQEEIETARQEKADLKASAKTKLMAGEPLTEEEANVMLGG